MKIQVKIMAIFILFFALAVISCGLGGNYTTPTNTVMYNGNTNTDGTVPIDTNTYLPTFTVTVLGNGTLTRAGYSFTCWNTQADGNGTDRAPASTFAMGSSNVVLYAKWTALPTYTVTYDANGGSGGLPTDTNNYLEGAAVTVLGNGTLANPGYTFGGWNTQADGNGIDRAQASTFAMGSSDVILYAKWTPIVCSFHMHYSVWLGSCMCDDLMVMQNGVCNLCPTGWKYVNGSCTCTKSKTNNCTQ